MQQRVDVVLLQFDKETNMNNTSKDFSEIQQAIIDLHNIARLVERDIGVGELSHQIRDAADTLTTLVRYSII